MRYAKAKRNPPVLLTLVNPGRKPKRAKHKSASTGGSTMARKRRRPLRRNKGAAKKPTVAKVKRAAKATATTTAKRVGKQAAKKAVAEAVPEIKKMVASAVKGAVKSVKKSTKKSTKRSSRKSSKRVLPAGAPPRPARKPKRGAFFAWPGRDPKQRTVKSYTRTGRAPGWYGVGGYKSKTGKSVGASWRLFENRRKPRRRHGKRRNAGYAMLPRSSRTGRFLKRGARRSFKLNRKVRRRRGTRKMRRNTRRGARGRFVSSHKRHYRRNKSRKGTRRSWLSRMFRWKRNEGVGAVVHTVESLVKPGLATAAGFFLARVAGNYVRNTFRSSESRPIRIMAPMLANVGVALAAWYLPRKLGALASLKPYSEYAAVGAMVGLAETLMAQFGGAFVQSYVAPPTTLGDSLDVYERALRGLNDGWNDYNPSDEYLLSTLADDDGVGEYITEPLGEYIEEPLGEYITEPGSDGSELLESATGIETGIYGPGVGDMGVEVEEAIAGVPIEAEEGLANHIFGSATGNGLFGLGADVPSAAKIASKAKLAAVQATKLGMGPTDAAKHAYAAVKASEGVSVGSAAFRAAVVAGVREALQSCGCCKPQRPTMPLSRGRRPVAPMVTGPQRCREVCSSSPTTKPGLRLVGGAPQLTQAIGSASSLKGDDLGDDMTGGGIFGGGMFGS